MSSWKDMRVSDDFISSGLIVDKDHTYTTSQRDLLAFVDSSITPPKAH